MTISEMHVWFRQYAQQMGQQNVRAILPEQIDLCINSSITDVVNQIIAGSIAVTNDRVLTDSSKLAQINALRTLYKTVECGPIETLENDYGYWKTTENLSSLINQATGNTSSSSVPYLYLVELAISYDLANTKNSQWFPIRVIDDAFLADTLNDFILRPRLRTPVGVMVNDKLELYVEPTDNKESLPYGVSSISTYRISYIAKPAVVFYGADLGQENVDCDLPEYMHIDILKHAVDLYRVAVSGGLSGQQQQQAPQQQEAPQQ